MGSQCYLPPRRSECLYKVPTEAGRPTRFRGAGAYTADTANAVPLFWLVRHTMHFAVPLFRPSNNNCPIDLILGAVSRRNEIMFTVSLFWHYLQNNIVPKYLNMIRFTSNKLNFYLHQQRSVALKYARNALADPAGELTTIPQTLLSVGEGNTPSPDPTP